MCAANYIRQNSPQSREKNNPSFARYPLQKRFTRSPGAPGSSGRLSRERCAGLRNREEERQSAGQRIRQPPSGWGKSRAAQPPIPQRRNGILARRLFQPDELHSCASQELQSAFRAADAFRICLCAFPAGRPRLRLPVKRCYLMPLAEVSAGVFTPLIRFTSWC